MKKPALFLAALLFLMQAGIILPAFFKSGKTESDFLLLSNFPDNQNISEGSMSVEHGTIRITILYDNYVFQKGTTADWGFSCLIEGAERVILFDTGTNGEILQHNIDELSVDITKVEEIVLSHQHQDHTGGLWTVLGQNADVTIHMPASFTSDFKQAVKKVGASVISESAPDSICAGVFLTGEMDDRIAEQSLFLESDSGLIVITGCSHPGIVEILQRVKTLHNDNIYLVVGGFHLMNHSPSQVRDIIEEIRKLGVKKIAPTHCTGEKAIDLFREAYGDHYMKTGTGKVFEF